MSDAKLPSPLASALKWIGVVGTLTAFALGSVEFMKTFAEFGERQRELTELRALAERQQRSADHTAAAATLQRAATQADEGGWFAKLTGRLDGDRRAIRRAQQDVAMQQLRDARVGEGQRFATLVDPLLDVLARGLPGADAQRRADLLAFIGWGYFLKSRDSGAARTDPDVPDVHYREALEAEPGNVYAHAHRAHWLSWRNADAAEVERHFAAALAGGRGEGAYVRRLQLSAVRNRGSDVREALFLKLANDMRRAGDPIDAQLRREVDNAYFYGLQSADRWQRLVDAVPPADQVTLLQALFLDLGADDARRQRAVDAIKRLQAR
jgi:hypothetical protein